MFITKGKPLAALLLALAVIMGGAAIISRFTRSPDEDSVEGTWEVLSFAPIELVSSEEMKQKVMSLTYIFEREKLLLKEVSGDNTIPEPYKLDSTKAPKTIDLAFGKGGIYAGIYKREGDKLTICYSWGPRPTEFEAEAGSDRALLVLKRKK
jgi:uncharacterized protein (TIGR03067 family)